MRILLLAALATLVGCASASRESDTAQTVPTAQLDSTAAPNAVASANVEREFKPPQGFSPKILERGTVYCKEMVVLGSRFPKEECMTEAQLKDHIATRLIYAPVHLLASFER